jgi:dolichyl-phosphate beta-glucosyltransferase
MSADNGVGNTSTAELTPVVSIILPAHNEAACLDSTLKTLSAYLAAMGEPFEIIVSDDGSTDETKLLDWKMHHDQHQTKYIRSEVRKGKGAALRRGMSSAMGRFLIYTDADLPVDLNSILHITHLLQAGQHDVICGDRRHPESVAVGQAAIRRLLASRLFNIGVQALALPGYKDSQCCLKGFTRDAVDLILSVPTTSSFAFDVEALYIAKLHHLSILRIPVRWVDARALIPIMSLVRVVASCLKDVAIMRLRYSRIARCVS